MKILIIQENGRHNDNRNFRECFCLKRAFENLNHICDIWGLGHANYNNIPKYDDYDIIINLENYDEDNWIPNLRFYSKPLKILWSIDAHCRGEEIFEKTFYEGGYNYLLHSTKDYVKKDYHIWFPNCYDDTLIKKLNISKKHKFGFCGNYVNRKNILLELKEKYNLHLDIFIIGEEMVKVINEYNCHFNLNIANDINYRSFETIGCGTILMTNYNENYKELGFVNEKNCLIYKNKSELNTYIENLDYFINKSDIAINGLELAKNHTYTKRIEKLLNDIKI